MSYNLIRDLLQFKLPHLLRCCIICLIYYVFMLCHGYYLLILNLIPFTMIYLFIFSPYQYGFIYYHLLHRHLLPFITNFLNGNKGIFITI